MSNLLSRGRQIGHLDPPKSVTSSVEARTDEARTDELAGRRHGLVTYEKLLRAGIGRAG